MPRLLTRQKLAHLLLSDRRESRVRLRYYIPRPGQTAGVPVDETHKRPRKCASRAAQQSRRRGLHDRKFVALLGCAVIARPRWASVQEAGRSYRIGWLVSNAPTFTEPYSSTFVQRLGELGFVEGPGLRKAACRRRDSEIRRVWEASSGRSSRPPVVSTKCTKEQLSALDA